MRKRSGILTILAVLLVGSLALRAWPFAGGEAAPRLGVARASGAHSSIESEQFRVTGWCADASHCWRARTPRG